MLHCHLSDLSWREAEISSSGYLIQFCVENAKSLLRRYYLSVQAIRKCCGFHCLTHFRGRARIGV